MIPRPDAVIAFFFAWEMLGASGQAITDFAKQVVKPVCSSQLHKVLASAWNERRVMVKALSSPGLFYSLPKFGVRVLVVDDNHTNRLVAVMALEKLGCLVDLADNGRMAVQKSLEFSHDLIFMDVNMPEMNGYEATVEIRRRVSRHVPVVAMTALALPGDPDTCLAAGMDDFMRKPVLIEDFVTMLTRWAPATVQWVQPSDMVIPTDTDSIPVAQCLIPLMETREERQHSESSGGSPPPALNPDKINKLRTLESSNGPSLYRHVCETFLQDAEARINALRRAVEEKDVERLGAEAHMLKGASLNIGADVVADIRGQLNVLGSVNGTVDGSSSWVAALEREVARVRAEIRDRA